MTQQDKHTHKRHQTEDQIKEQLTRWINENPNLEKNSFNEEEKLRNRESQSRQDIVHNAFDFWKDVEQKREKWKKFLLYGFVIASFVQILFIMLIVIVDAFYDGFHIRENVFISVILGTLAQIIGVVMVITRNLFDNKRDKIISFIAPWIERK